MDHFTIGDSQGFDAAWRQNFEFTWVSVGVLPLQITYKESVMKKILVVAAFCGLCVSCGNNPNRNPDYNNRTQSNVNQPSDDNITDSVKQRLRSDSTLSSSARMVSVSTYNGVVTLTGTVANSNESRRIESMVLGVPGVQSVDNQLTLTNNY